MGASCQWTAGHPPLSAERLSTSTFVLVGQPPCSRFAFPFTLTNLDLRKGASPLLLLEVSMSGKRNILLLFSCLTRGKTLSQRNRSLWNFRYQSAECLCAHFPKVSHKRLIIILHLCQFIKWKMVSSGLTLHFFNYKLFSCGFCHVYVFFLNVAYSCPLVA